MTKYHYVVAHIAESFGIEGERISFGDSIQFDGGWAAEHMPSYFPGIIIPEDRVEELKQKLIGTHYEGCVNERWRQSL